MSNVPPPPPPPFGGNVPPAPGGPPPNQGGYSPPSAYTPPPAYAPQQPGYGQYPQAPAGYQPYPQSPGTGRVESAKGLRTATIVAFWTMTAASAFIALAMFSRKSKFDDFVNGDFVTFDELQDADSLVGGAVLLSWLAQLFAVIMVCLWAGKIVRNAQARGVQGLSSGMAVGGWWIPIGWYWLGFQQLSKSVKGLNRSAPSLTGWQISFIIAQVGSGVLYAIRTDVNDSSGDFSGKLSQQGFVSAGSAVLFLVATIFAMKATKEIDTAVSGA